MTEQERREAARQFYNKWNGRGREDEDDRSFWFDMLQDVLGMEKITDRVEFQKKVVGPDGNTKRIDAYIPETRVLIEQKSLGIQLDKPQSGHNGMTPYEQAKMYDNSLPHNEKSKWIVLSNFEEIWIYDMDERVPEPTKLSLSDIQDQYTQLDFLFNKEVKRITLETELSIKAGELVGKIYERFQGQYTDPFAKHTQRSLNILCVRLVFCLYAEDAGLFNTKTSFKDYIVAYRPQDVRQALISLFQVLDTPLNERADLYLSDELEGFPYVNGGLFADENIVIPKITEELKTTIIEASDFDWADISPTIFGAVFESTLNPETRRAGGMHYTSIENIHKVIDPLFLDELAEELNTILAIGVNATKVKKLKEYQDKLSKLRFLDPACGSGNFLTETYTSLRRLENKAIRAILDARKGQVAGQIDMNLEEAPTIKVQINQFYGIEINDFAVTVAKSALWIAESQMMKETEDVLHMNLDFLPLKTNANIVEGNALRVDWNDIVPKYGLSYIMGNPPFVGKKYQDDSKKGDMLNVFGKGWKGIGNLDYVTAWYKKACDYINNTSISVSFVSTSSIVQGEHVPLFWKELYNKYNVHIDFGYKPFIWDSEASKKASVFCVIIGFSLMENNRIKYLFDNNNGVQCKSIHPYLIDMPLIFVENRNNPIQDVTPLVYGSFALDDGNYTISEIEYEEMITKEPHIKKYLKLFIGSEEFINNRHRYCVWLKDVSPSDIRSSSILLDKIKNVKEWREKSNRPGTVKAAETPTLFAEIRQPDDDYMAIPITSSERRRYIPIGYMSKEIIASNHLLVLPNADKYQFGVLISNVHMAWMRTVAGRMKSDYNYSAKIVYNNFPWPNPTDAQKQTIEKTAQGILDARNLYLDCSLADLYDPLTMPPELRKAHQENDKAVMQAYGFDIKTMSEADCVAELMKMYQKLTEK